jgi:hypothetical protein
MLRCVFKSGDHPKTAEAIARKINLILGDTRETLAARTGRTPADVYEDEVDAVVVHGDDIDGLQGWQWDQSELIFGSFAGFDGNATGQYLANRKSCLLELRLSINWRSVCHSIIAAGVCLKTLPSSKTGSSFGSHCWGVCFCGGLSLIHAH